MASGVISPTVEDGASSVLTPKASAPSIFCISTQYSVLFMQNDTIEKKLDNVKALDPEPRFPFLDFELRASFLEENYFPYHSRIPLAQASYRLHLRHIRGG
ncbi:UNVERIFIED_CONTAM: hypothetical protein Sradi_7099000 [Sesamum radiatum]|uniref:Uncharacterized protein n=1 Tax=Sesamum radiatum TaxID=300843 RepID=A0AAW2J1D8_SESRA